MPFGYEIQHCRLRERAHVPSGNSESDFLGKVTVGIIVNVKRMSQLL